ncbi:MAG: ParB/RepB/Spo0J family partition protein [Crocinitomicaceae bacterium]|jgi:ParB family transcriptional regulator, chromosome partitioning protein|nr:ParB/RepB/Spo0J family partition protein [Crocinitomicaceae bacterium]MDP4866124.1 ParB/RepB/Spo0J family partition protein [Crocinitomicaceae bacterium]MDP5011770.1 ParB/RepB/Spo0J family partition protein [Crocinitomicaceae bacterium]
MSSNTKKRPPLGKGLSALLENTETDITSKSSNAGVVGSVSMLSIDSIEANPFNPRTNFEKSALDELSQSISIHGIIQPLTVRKLGRDKYQLISGERRFRASQLAGLKEVPAYIRVANDQTMLEMALVENIQREDLNSIEVALSYSRLIEECSLTQDQLSQKIAKSRSSITNHLRLLKLPADIQAAVRDNVISMGHARALVSVGDEALQLAIYARIVEDGLSVRDAEALVREGYVEPRDTQANPKEKSKSSADISDKQFVFKEHLSDKLSAKIEIKKSNGGNGKIIVNFNSEVDLNRIIQLLNK